MRAVAHRFTDFPTPDYSKIPPKVSCWRKKPKTVEENKNIAVDA
jgi:hypothetical protein